jgi:hypothetical protein
MFRQGDILLVPILEEDLPQALVPVARDGRGKLVLALGEVTGHAHAVRATDADLVADATELDRRYLRIAADAMLTHEEHGPIPLPPGLYQVVRQREYVHGGPWFRSVAD